MWFLQFSKHSTLLCKLDLAGLPCYSMYSYRWLDNKVPVLEFWGHQIDERQVSHGKTPYTPNLFSFGCIKSELCQHSKSLDGNGIETEEENGLTIEANVDVQS